MTTYCSVETCHSTEIEAKGLCNAHYRRLLRHGDPEGGGLRNGTKMEWLKAHSGYSQDDCLVWPYPDNGNGYCRVSIGYEKDYAHRMMCALAHGPAPFPKARALHICGNGHNGCLNPRHLKWGSNSENQLQRVADGTHQRGERHPAAKLTEQQAREIINSAGTPIAVLADRMGIKYATIQAVRLGRSWKWLSPTHNQ